MKFTLRLIIGALFGVCLYTMIFPFMVTVTAVSLAAWCINWLSKEDLKFSDFIDDLDIVLVPFNDIKKWIIGNG